MRILPLFVLLTMLVACSDSKFAATSACQSVVSLGERYASTLRLAQSDVRTRAMTIDEVAQQLTGWSLKPVTFEQLDQKVSALKPLNLSEVIDYPEGNGDSQARFLEAMLDSVRNGKQPGLMEVELNYDVDNGNGFPERRSGSCRFLAADIKAYEPAVNFDTLVSLERARQRAFGPVTYPNRGGECCVPQFALAQTHPATAKINMQTGDLIGDEVKGGVVMTNEISRAIAIERSSRGVAR